MSVFAIKRFSVKTRKGNYSVEEFSNGDGSLERYRLMHDRRYITAETFFDEESAISALLEHLKRVFVKQMSLQLEND